MYKVADLGMLRLRPPMNIQGYYTVQYQFGASLIIYSILLLYTIVLFDTNYHPIVSNSYIL